MWEAAAELGVPVTIHIADPIAFFDPLDERNERLEELLANPDWWFGGRRPPARSTAAGVVRVARGPATRRPRSSARTWPAPQRTSRGSAGCSTRTRTCTPTSRHGSRSSGGSRGRRGSCIETHPDRVLFGTDLFPPTREIYAIHFRFLETFDEHFAYDPEDPPPQGRWAISGLGLPSDILAAVDRRNARRLIPGLA